MSPPRRLPTTSRERQNVLNTRMAPGSRMGQTRNARPIAPNPLATNRRTIPTGAVEFVGYLTATSTALGLVNFNTDAGTPSSAYYTVPTAGTPGVSILHDGWYVAVGTALIRGATAGDSFSCTLDTGGGVADSAYGFCVAAGSGGIGLSGTSPVLQLSGGLSVVQFTVTQVAGGGSGAYLADVYAVVTKFT